MNLKNNQITLGILLDNPRSRGILQKNFGTLLNHPMITSARGMTLQQIIALSTNHIPQRVINQTLQELKEL